MSEIKVGDQVSWTHVGGGSKTITMSLREGMVESIAGAVATVKKKSGRRERIMLVCLRTKGQKSQITEFVEAVVEANRDKEA
jgi:hypothetical protein